MPNTIPPTVPNRIITHAELQKHDEDHDRQWIAIDGIVVDVTEYKDSHPGGYDLLEQHAGQDGTTEFKTSGHSTEARTILYELAVGRLEENVKRNVTNPGMTQVANQEPPKTGNSLSWVAVGLSLSAIGVASYYLINKKAN